jgi:hypothetical protein
MLVVFPTSPDAGMKWIPSRCSIVVLAFLKSRGYVETGIWRRDCPGAEWASCSSFAYKRPPRRWQSAKIHDFAPDLDRNWRLASAQAIWRRPGSMDNPHSVCKGMGTLHCSDRREDHKAAWINDSVAHASRYEQAKKMSSCRKTSNCFSGTLDSSSLRLTAAMVSCSIEATSGKSLVSGSQVVASIPAITLLQRTPICRTIFCPVQIRAYRVKGNTRLCISHLGFKKRAD